MDFDIELAQDSLNNKRTKTNLTPVKREAIAFMACRDEFYLLQLELHRYNRN
jgi:hypothetical protein